MDLYYLTYFLKRMHFFLLIFSMLILELDVTRSNIPVAIGRRTPGFRNLPAIDPQSVCPFFFIYNSLFIKME